MLRSAKAQKPQADTVRNNSADKRSNASEKSARGRAGCDSGANVGAGALEDVLQGFFDFGHIFRSGAVGDVQVDVGQSEASAPFYPVYPWTLTRGEMTRPAAGEPDPTAQPAEAPAPAEVAAPAPVPTDPTSDQPE